MTDTGDRAGPVERSAGDKRGAALPEPNGARRRRRVESGGRPNQVKVRFTDEELARVRSRAAEVGLTAASYLAEIGQAARPGLPTPAGEQATGATGIVVPAPRERLVIERGGGFGVMERRALATELAAVRRILSGVATNLNQMAKIANSRGHQLPMQVAAAAAMAMRHMARLNDLELALDPRRRR